MTAVVAVVAAVLLVDHTSSLSHDVEYGEFIASLGTVCQCVVTQRGFRKKEVNVR